MTYSSGYVTNLTVVSSLMGRGDYVFSDKLNHASIVDGCLMSGAEFRRFRHNDLLRAHQRIFIFGVGPSTTLVNLLQVRLGRFGWQVIPLATAGREILEPLLLMTDQDLLFAIGFFDISPALQFVLNYANEVHCPVVMLTDTLGSIIGNQADVILTARRGPVSGFHSLVVPMTIINTLLLALASEDQETVMARLDRLDQLRDRFKNSKEAL